MTDNLTVTIQIGNSDDKLTQSQWSRFVHTVNDYVMLWGEIHFFGTSDGDKPWQNATWIIELDRELSINAHDKLRRVAKLFGQDSIAWTEGVTQFIGGDE